MPHHVHRLVEPFAGLAAISIAAASEKRADFFYLNDLNAPHMAMLKEAIETPFRLLEEYERVWQEQFTFSKGSVEHFYHVRGLFNEGVQTPANMLYLLARRVKGSVRYGKDGRFNQSPDKRRNGTSPQTLEGNLEKISALLNGKTTFSAVDYRDVFEQALPGDLFYLDPPYQGVSNTRDHRYLAGISFREFADSLEILNRKGVDFLVSYDGACGDREYGDELPKQLGCRKVLLNAGLSTQALFLGKKSDTYEALYVSESLAPVFDLPTEQLTLWEVL